jgi:ectoine hydroxylase-related dioxygenase (phytanoyl-CoA dioxygenase family)
MKDFYAHKLIKDNIININEIINASQELKVKNKFTTNQEHIYEVKSNEIINHTCFNNLMFKIKDLIEENFDTKNIIFQKLWLVETEYKHTDKSKLPYKLHFDKRRFFKGMVYLNDVTENHGPIHFGKIRQEIKIDKLRRKLPENYKDLNLNYIEEKYLLEKPKPLLGQKGDIILFDTNEPHHAGVVLSNFTRKVLRFDFYLKSFNEESLFIKLKKYFSSSTQISN